MNRRHMAGRSERRGGCGRWRTDAQRFLARKAQAFGDDAGPRHHDRCAIHDGGLGPERVLVQNLVKIEAAQRGAFVRCCCRWAWQVLIFEVRP
jgi:hypothetical protein